MCFSATASFVAGSTLSIAGIAILVRVEHAREVPLASIPLLFGVQQLAEGVVWISLESHREVLNTVATYVYSAFSHVVWPVLVPIAVGLLETVPWRRRLLRGAQAIGIAVGIYLLYSMVRYSIASTITGRSIDYVSPNFYIVVVMAAYFAATLGSPLMSSYRSINLFGFLGLIGAVAAYLVRATTFISAWCFFAAVVSVAIYRYFMHSTRDQPVVSAAG